MKKRDLLNDHSKLKGLAEAATPGPWKQDGDQVTQYGQVVGVYIAREDGARIGQTFSNCLVKTAEHCRANAEFIAAAHPGAVSELISENEALRKALAGMLFAFDDGVGREWSAEMLNYARKLCPAVEFKP